MKKNNRLKRFTEILQSPTPPVGQTPREVIWKKNKAALYFYPAQERKYETPLFLIYSLVNQSFILDLGPDVSMIEAFTNEGYDVYLLDFGIPRYEDKAITVDDLISKYIQKAVQRALRHAKAREITVIGYCLGGTLATMYAAIADEPVKNLILFAAPLDFNRKHFNGNIYEAIQNGELSLDPLIEEYGVIPGKFVEIMVRLISSPISYSQYIALYDHIDDKEYVDKWLRFYSWVRGHIPFIGATLKQLHHDLIKENKLINNKLYLSGKHVNLKNIHSNLLVISTEDDQLIPEALIQPILDKVSSEDKTYRKMKGGHVTVAIKGEIPQFLADWLSQRS